MVVEKHSRLKWEHATIVGLTLVVGLLVVSLIVLTVYMVDMRTSLEEQRKGLTRVTQDLQTALVQEGKGVAKVNATYSTDDMALVGEENDTCPMGFTQFGFKCYRVFDVKASWIEAKMYCRIMGADLASIHNEATHDFLQQLVTNVSGNLVGYWLDGSDLPSIDNWHWMGENGVTHEHFAYYNWHSTQPNDHDSYSTCMGMWKDFLWLWHDLTCDRRDVGFICQA